jgi:outer membrane protein TolC
MRLKKTVILTTLIASNLLAINIDEAVELALKNSNDIKQKNQELKIANYSKEQSFGAFLPSVDLGYAYNDRDTTRYSANSVDSQMSATLTYNLFSGMSHTNLYEASKLNSNIAKEYLTSSTEDVVLNTKVAYIDYLRAKESLKVQKESLALLKKQFEDTKLMYSQGMVAKNDVLKVEVELLSIEQALNRAISDVKIAKINLEKTIGETLVTEPQKVEKEATSVELETLKNKMYTNRSELKALVDTKKALQYQKKSVNGNFMPKVDLTTSYTKFGNEGIPDGRDGLEDETVVGVSASWNIYNGNIDNLSKQKYMSQILSTDAQIDELKKNLNLQLVSAYENYTLAISNLKLAQKAQESAKENYKIVQNQYKQGIAKTTDTLDAREYLTRANSEYNLAYFDTITSLFTLQRISQTR